MRTPPLNANPADDYLSPAVERVAQLRIDLDIWFESETAAAIGWEECTLQSRRLTGGDCPPHVRLGRRIVYHGDDVKAWLRAKVTHAANGMKLRAKGRVAA